MGSPNWIRGLVVPVCAMVLVVLQSCGGGGGGGAAQPQQPAIASIDVTTQSNTCVTPPDTLTYTAVARDANGNAIAGVTFSWSSSTTTVATVDANGVATAAAPGSTQITASAGGVRSTPSTLQVCAIVVGPPAGSVVLSGDVSGATERETPLATQTSTNYHFTFVDPFTRSVMFHNTFYANAKNGEAVTVRAFYKVEGQTTWAEEDWTGYEWIGFCRDLKVQRLSDLVVVTSGGAAAVTAAQPPRLMRNVVGCFKFTGTAKRVTVGDDFTSGTVELTASPVFSLGNTPHQLTLASEGRLRVPLAAPTLAVASWRLIENYAAQGCSRTLDQTIALDPTVEVGGPGFATIVVNNFIDSLPADVRQQQVTLHGPTSLVYTANGGSSRVEQGFEVCPTGSGPYSSAASLWLLNHDETAPAPVIDRLDGTLAGTFVETGSGSTNTYTWTLTPEREP